MGDRQIDTARRHVPVRTGEELLFNRRLGSKLRERRQAAELTQDDLAGQAGMTRGSIANIERGEQMPGLYRLILICAALKCDLGEVIPSEGFSPESIADAMSDEYSSALKNVRRQALKQRVASVSSK